jgi:hypothetical protein
MSARQEVGNWLRSKRIPYRNPSFGTLLAANFQNRRIDTLSHDEIAQWCSQRVLGGAQATKHRVSKYARRFLSFARERGYTSVDLASAN